MRIAITGASGLVGTALRAALVERRHEVVRLVRRRAGAADEAGYDPEREFHDPDRVEGCGAVVHLAGESLGHARWSAEKRRAIRHSRYEGTRKLCQNVALLSELPEVLVVVVCTGFYGDRGDEVLTETSARGRGDAAEFGEDWESAAEMMEAVGVRLVVARLGLVLSSRGGVLPALVQAQRQARAGVLGGGAQWLPWIHEDDAVAALLHVVDARPLSGPVNVVAPEPVRQRDFTAALAAALGVSPAPPLDAAQACDAFGDLAAELLLPSRRVLPAALTGAGFRWRAGDLPRALEGLRG